MNSKEEQERMSKISRDINEALTKSPVMRNLFGRNQASYRYLEDKNKNRYFYTTAKIEHKGLIRYVAGIYKYKKTKKQWKLSQKVGFAKKRLAINWAQKEREKNNN